MRAGGQHRLEREDIISEEVGGKRKTGTPGVSSAVEEEHSPKTSERNCN